MRDVYYGQIYQSDSHRLHILVRDSAGDPVTGLLFSDISVSYLRSVDTSAQVLPLSGPDWTEISNGIYILDIPSVISTFTGLLTMIITGSLFDDIVARIDVVAKNPGNVQLNILVEDSGNIAIAGVQVDIWNSNDTAIVWSGVSDINGEVVTALLPGSYKVRPRGNQIDFGSLPISLTVTGPSIESLTITGNALATPSAPSDPNVCRIFGYVYDICGIPDNQTSPDYIAINVQRDAKQYKLNNYLLTMDGVRIGIDENGYFEFDLVRGLTVHLKIPRLNLEKNFVVPDQASENLINII